MEVDEAIIYVDAHLQNDPVDLFLASELTDSDPYPHSIRQELEEVWDMLGFHFNAGVSVREGAPGRLESFEINLEALKRVILLQVVLLELLQDYQDE